MSLSRAYLSWILKFLPVKCRNFAFQRMSCYFLGIQPSFFWFKRVTLNSFTVFHCLDHFTMHNSEWKFLRNYQFICNRDIPVGVFKHILGWLSSKETWKLILVSLVDIPRDDYQREWNFFWPFCIFTSKVEKLSANISQSISLTYKKLIYRKCKIILGI